LTQDHIIGLIDRPAGLFTEQELAALDLAEALFRENAGTAGADPDLMARLREHFTDGALVELCWAIGQFIGLGKMIAFLGLERETE
jgi:alkylhydroperoxidase family enzyme